jgi:ribosome-associated protein
MRVTPSLEIPDEEFELKFSRSGGPGGQNVNRRSTKVEVAFDVANSPTLSEHQRALMQARLASRIDADGYVRVTASDARTQGTNRAHALSKMETLLARALAPPPPPRRKTKPTRSAKEKRLQEKRTRSERKRERSRPEID